ncbi:MAG: HDOD domain-containing protein [Phycisphaerae bacterium]
MVSRLKAGKQLPSPPRTALHILELCRSEDSDVHELADVIMSDPALSSRLLRYANSSIVGAGRKVTSIRDAVLLLGFRAVKLTALGFSIASPDFRPRCPGFDLRRFWSGSFATAAIARRITVERFDTDREEAFTAGLLVNIGRLALAYGLPDDYKQVMQAVRAGKPLMEAERDLFGLDHLQFAAQLLAEWGLPELLVETLRRQTIPSTPVLTDGHAQLLAQIIRLSRQLVPLFIDADKLSREQRDAAHHVVENELKLDEQSWQRLADQVLSDYRQVAEWFDVQLGDRLDVFELYAEAQQQATRVGMVAQLERTRALEENKNLLQRATTDPVTGIANRARFEERVQHAVAGLRRGHGHFALLMFDIDQFKRFNDMYGHHVGDLVLKQVAQTAQAALREVDLLARYGGDEFMILAPHTDQRGACTIAARIRKCLDDLRIKVGDHTLHLTVSVGLVLTSDYQEVPDAEQIVADADTQLYVSKRAGRNTWSYCGRAASELTRVVNRI